MPLVWSGMLAWAYTVHHHFVSYAVAITTKSNSS